MIQKDGLEDVQYHTFDDMIIRVTIRIHHLDLVVVVGRVRVEPRELDQVVDQSSDLGRGPEILQPHALLTLFPSLRLLLSGFRVALDFNSIRRLEARLANGA